MIDLDNLRGALGDAKRAVTDLESRIMDLYIQRDEIEAQPPCADDVADWLRRGLDSAADSFAVRMERYFTADWLARQKGSFTMTQPAPQLVGLPHLGQSGVTLGAGMPELLAQPDAKPDIAALTYFLRPMIEKQIPKIVKDFFPFATGSVPAAERMKQLAAIDSEIALTQQQLRDLQEQIKQVRDALLA